MCQHDSAIETMSMDLASVSNHRVRDGLLVVTCELVSAAWANLFECHEAMLRAIRSVADRNYRLWRRPFAKAAVASSAPPRSASRP